jgi:hypothetical protein
MQTPLLQNAESDELAAFLKGLADQKLAVVIHETWAHRKVIRRVKQEAWRPTIPSVSIPETPTASFELQSSTPSPKKTKGTKRKEQYKKKKAKEEKEERQTAEAWSHPELPSPECDRCKDEPMENKCIRVYEVHKRADAKRFTGVAMTCANPGDRLKPLPLVRN